MKTNNLKRYSLVLSSLVIILGIVLLSATPPQQVQNWFAPKAADTIKNPFKNNVDATAKGKATYTKMCVVCHGTKGKGDGVAGANLNPRPHNLTAGYIQSQTDGAFFWKITTGKAPMASYSKILTTDQRWQVINYVRELAKPATK